MTREEVIEMARKAGIADGIELPEELESIFRFAALVAAAEREACAKEAEYYAPNSLTATNIACAIRARGEP